MDKEMMKAFSRDLRRIERNIEYTLKNQTSCCGVSRAQCHALLELHFAGAVSLASLSEMLVLDPSTVSRTIDAMTGAALVERRPDPKNRRRVVLTLTAAGQKKAASINDACDRMYSAAVSKMSPARLPVLADVVRVLADLMDTARGCCDREGK